MNRPAAEPGFRLDRQEASDRRIRYSLTLRTDQPPVSGTAREAAPGRSCKTERVAAHDSPGPVPRGFAMPRPVPARGCTRQATPPARRHGAAAARRSAPAQTSWRQMTRWTWRPRRRRCGSRSCWQAGRRVHRPGAGQGPGQGDRRAAARRPAPGPVRAHLVPAEPAHVLHRQPRHRQDDRGHAHGRAAARARLPAQGPAGQRHPGRPGRPVRGPHRPEDQGGAQARDGRGAAHRRGVLPVPAGERARLRPGIDRDPAAVHGGAPRRTWW